MPARAKINLFLDILERRPDGYHSIQTVLRTVGLADTVSVIPRADRRVTVHCDDAAVPCDERNLAVRAAQALRAAFPDRVRGFHIEIAKRIPAGAGLGGGSADAAATLRLIREASDLKIDDEGLAAIAARVGSDVPFLFHGGTMLAAGRGEILTPLENRCSEGGLVIVCPNASVSTAEAYRWWDESGRPRTRRSAEEMQAALAKGDWKGIAACCENAFQTVVERRVPEVAAVREALIEAGCLTAVLSGSGAAVFGLTESAEAARRVASTITSRYRVLLSSSFDSRLTGGNE